jgi:predicted ABC-type transport system involved in lysophospholipase L1 biosynthesis ATPase subunit
MTAEAIVEARGVSKTYDTGKIQVSALADVDLTIRRGEMSR